VIGIRDAFPDLEFHSDTNLMADGDHIICGLEGGGTHTGPAFIDCLIGFLPANSGQKLHLAGTAVLRINDGKIIEDTTRMTWMALLPRFRKAATYLGNDEPGQINRPDQPQPDLRQPR
jgi:predicted ester cyclase